MYATRTAGLTGDWVNAWLAAVGIVVLVPGMRLSWTRMIRPVAVLHHPSADSTAALATVIAAHLPTVDEMDRLVIAKHLPGCIHEFGRNPTTAAMEERADAARRGGDPTLAFTITDLHIPRDGQFEHSPFDPPAPKGITMADRIAACRRLLEPSPEALIAATLNGTAARVKNNGLGFDHRRFVSPTAPVGDVWVDPVVEVLAAVGLTVLPSRGDGARAQHRGWTGRATQAGAFTWPTWRPVLGAAGVDAILDIHWGIGVHPDLDQVYSSVPYQPRSSMDPTRGYASRRLR